MNTQQHLPTGAPAQAQAQPAHTRALRMSRVCEKTGLSRAHIYKLVRAGRFPAPYKLSERVSAWSEQEISDWLEAKFARGGAHA